MNVNEIICLAITPAIIAFLLTGLFCIYWLLDIKKNGIEVSATITKEATSNKGPIIKYTCLNGETIQKRYIFSNSFMFSKYKVNHSIKIKYKPDKPKKVWIIGDNSPLFLGSICIGLPVFIIILILLILLKIF